MPDSHLERAERTHKAEQFLDKHMIPVILGPKDRHYVIDHHHLARALHDEGVKDVAVTIIANLSKLDHDSFWFVMDNRDWTHPFDSNGRRFMIGVKLIDVKGMRELFRLQRDEFRIALLTAATVVAFTVMYGIAVAISLSLLDQVRHAYRPRTRVLAKDAEARWCAVPAAPDQLAAPLV